MRLITERGGIHALPQEAGSLNQRVQDASSGRTTGVHSTDERTRAGAAQSPPGAAGHGTQH
jgi:hypothetical protein